MEERGTREEQGALWVGERVGSAETGAGCTVLLPLAVVLENSSLGDSVMLTEDEYRTDCYLLYPS